jgi:hypothetical protein
MKQSTNVNFGSNEHLTASTDAARHEERAEEPFELERRGGLYLPRQNSSR